MSKSKRIKELISKVRKNVELNDPPPDYSEIINTINSAWQYNNTTTNGWTIQNKPVIYRGQKINVPGQVVWQSSSTDEEGNYHDTIKTNQGTTINTVNSQLESITTNNRTDTYADDTDVGEDNTKSTDELKEIYRIFVNEFANDSTLGLKWDECPDYTTVTVPRYSACSDSTTN